MGYYRGSFRITDDPNKELDSNTYTITRTYRSAYCVASRRTGRHGSGKYGSRRVVRFNVKIDKPIASLTGVAAINTGASNPDRKAVEFLRLYSVDAETYTSTNPAIFETYPKEAIDLDLYYSASNIYKIENAGTTSAAHQSLKSYHGLIVIHLVMELSQIVYEMIIMPYVLTRDLLFQLCLTKLMDKKLKPPV